MEKTEIRGNGITARSVNMIANPIAEDFLAHLAAYTDDIKRNGFFGSVISNAVQWSRRVLKSAARSFAPDSKEDFAPDSKEDFAPDSKEDFARRILRLKECAESEIAKGNADSAARFAFQMGQLVGGAALKFEWEKNALAGQKIVAGLKSGTATSNAERTRIAKEKKNCWQEKADNVWKKNPTLSTKRVAEIIAEDCNAAASTIRQKITKPQKVDGAG